MEGSREELEAAPKVLRAPTFILHEDTVAADDIWVSASHGHGSKPMGSHFGVGAPPIFVYISGWIGMFTGGSGF